MISGIDQSNDPKYLFGDYKPHNDYMCQVNAIQQRYARRRIKRFSGNTICNISLSPGIDVEYHLMRTIMDVKSTRDNHRCLVICPSICYATSWSNSLISRGIKCTCLVSEACETDIDISDTQFILTTPAKVAQTDLIDTLFMYIGCIATIYLHDKDFQTLVTNKLSPYYEEHKPLPVPILRITIPTQSPYSPSPSHASTQAVVVSTVEYHGDNGYVDVWSRLDKDIEKGYPIVVIVPSEYMKDIYDAKGDRQVLKSVHYKRFLRDDDISNVLLVSDRYNPLNGYKTNIRLAILVDIPVERHPKLISRWRPYVSIDRSLFGRIVLYNRKPSNIEYNIVPQQLPHPLTSNVDIHNVTGEYRAIIAGMKSRNFDGTFKCLYHHIMVNTSYTHQFQWWKGMFVAMICEQYISDKSNDTELEKYTITNTGHRWYNMSKRKAMKYTPVMIESLHMTRTITSMIRFYHRDLPWSVFEHPMIIHAMNTRRSRWEKLSTVLVSKMLDIAKVLGLSSKQQIQLNDIVVDKMTYINNDKLGYVDLEAILNGDIDAITDNSDNNDPSANDGIHTNAKDSGDTEQSMYAVRYKPLRVQLEYLFDQNKTISEIRKLLPWVQYKTINKGIINMAKDNPKTFNFEKAGLTYEKEYAICDVIVNRFGGMVMDLLPIKRFLPKYITELDITLSILKNKHT